MAQKRNVLPDTASDALEHLLRDTSSDMVSGVWQPESRDPVETDGQMRQSRQGPGGDLPGLSDLAEGLTRDEFDDVLLDILHTGEERDPDGFDDSLFFESAPNVPPAQAPEATARIRRLAGVWQGRRRIKTPPVPRPPSGHAPTDAALEGLLANSNTPPRVAATAESVSRLSDLLRDDVGPTGTDAEDEAAAKARLASVFADEDDRAPARPHADDTAAGPETDPLAELLGSDPFDDDPLDDDGLDDDLLDEVLGVSEPSPPASTSASPSVTAPVIPPVTPPASIRLSPRLAADVERPARDRPAGEDDFFDDIDLGDAPDEPDDDWLDGVEEDAIAATPPEPEAALADTRATPAIAAVQDLIGDDLLAELLRDDDPVQATRDAPATTAFAPATPATPAPFKSPDPIAEPRPRREPARRSGMKELDHVLQAEAARRAPQRKWLVRLIWLALLGGLLYVAFLPYRFEVGGEFTIQPFDRAEVRARTSGEITTVNVREGDWVEAGEVLAVLANWNQTHNLALIRSEGERLQAQLATLTDGARAEEITVAEQTLASAEVQLARALQDLERQETLFASGTITLKAVEDARSARDLALSARDQAAAALALVRAGPRETDVEALQATIAGNAEQQEFAELMLEYTNVRAPVAGQIVSSLNEVPVGFSMPTGGLFAEIEDNRTVIAELAVPEITIEEVEIGAPVELRLWSNPDDAITGTVRSIAPRAEEQDFGWAVRVQVEVPNPDGRLAANMTGFGKIEAAERPVWEAFSRAIERFFVIELWSWLP